MTEALTEPAPLSARKPTLPGLEDAQAVLPLEIEPDQRRTAGGRRTGAAGPGEEEPIEAEAATRSTGETVSEGVERYLAQLELVKSIFGIERLDEGVLSAIADEATRPHTSPKALAAVTAELESKQALINGLRDERSLLEEALEDAQADSSRHPRGIGQTRDTERWLRRQLEDACAFDVARADVPDEWREKVPASFSEWVETLESDSDGSVVFTGDADAALALDANDLGTACRAAWEAVLTLREYVRARTDACFQGSVDQFVKHPPSGYRTCPSRRHAQGETAATMQPWGHERVLPVPITVRASGAVEMAAHFKLGQLARISPRLHYYDDFLGIGRIYIGYIGRHLTNTQT